MLWFKTMEDSFCRTCLSEKRDNFTSIDEEISNVIEDCASVKVLQEGSLKVIFICEECLNTVINFQKFKMRFQEVERLIKSKYENDLKIKFMIDKSQNAENINEYCRANGDNVFENKRTVESSEKRTVTKTEKGTRLNELKSVNSKFNCDICSKSFKNKDLLTSHLSKNHEDTTPNDFINGHDDFIEDTGIPDQYENITTYEKLPVNQLKEKKSITLKKEILNQNIKCDLCSKKFKNASFLQRHLGKIHIQQNKSVDENVNINQNISIENVQENLTSFKFRKEIDLNLRFNTVNGEKNTFKCNNCDKSFAAEKSLAAHQRTHLNNPKKSHKCSVCDKSFQNLSSLAKHVKVSHNFPAIKCSDCDMTFHLTEMLDKHWMYQHSEKCPSCELGRSDTKNYHDHLRRCLKGLYKNEPQKCKFCGSVYRHLKSLITHVNRKHSEKDKRKVCLTCGKLVYDINGHEKSHPKNPPGQSIKFTCRLCGNKFDSRLLVRHHHKQAHAEEMQNMERKFSCDVCEKKFIRKISLKIHKTYTHSNDYKFGCTLCPKSFKIRHQLSRHLMYHTGQKEFECEICKKRFFQNWELNKHKRIHTKEKRYGKEVVVLPENEIL